MSWTGVGGSCSSTTTTAPWRDKSRLENRCNAAEEICRERPDSSPAVEASLDRCRGSSCASMHVLCSQLLSRDCDESPCFMFNLSILTCRMHMQMSSYIHVRALHRSNHGDRLRFTYWTDEHPSTRSCSLSAKRSIGFHPTLAWRLRGH